MSLYVFAYNIFSLTETTPYFQEFRKPPVSTRRRVKVTAGELESDGVAFTEKSEEESMSGRDVQLIRYG